ncbi:MAG: succinylglutamate desuccinylase/aspartoacylase family protein [Candidatus Cloacimonetes bacterium]|nr:succinylglutamate desuccinylase/aspartoacylase family protein [Candidatus Cloacimonadota bacterium]
MSKILTIKTQEELDVLSLKKGQVHRLQIELSDNAVGVPWSVPVIVLRGVKKGPVLGITAALHGNELNGISTIFQLLKEVDASQLSGTLIMVPISNVPGYLRNQREFSDNVDLNRIMPGKIDGVPSSIYAHHFINKIVKKFDYLLDLHTASHGRVNSLYIRADLETEMTRTLAYLQKPQIIVKKGDEDGTLRGWANDAGIPAITIEIGNANLFQYKLIDETLDGILNTLKYLNMISGEVEDLIEDSTICSKSYWIYTKRGGIIEVLPKLADRVNSGDLIATVSDVFGQVKEEIFSEHSGIVIGKNVRPNCDSGNRVLHLGVDIIEADSEDIPGHDDYEDPED